jgi:hypothetical protein
VFLPPTEKIKSPKFPGHYQNFKELPDCFSMVTPSSVRVLLHPLKADSMTADRKL